MRAKGGLILLAHIKVYMKFSIPKNIFLMLMNASSELQTLMPNTIIHGLNGAISMISPARNLGTWIAFRKSNYNKKQPDSFQSRHRTFEHSLPAMLERLGRRFNETWRAYKRKKTY